jgi:hypothetical protein
MAREKIKMPSDKQIWAEVDKQLAVYPEVVKNVNGIPNRQDLFDKKKAWYKDAPKRLQQQQAADKAKEAAAKKQAEEDKAYIALRKAQGKPVITVKRFKTDFPNIKEDKLAKCSAKELHERHEMVGFIMEARAILSKYKRLQAATRELTYKYLSQTYGLYRRIIKTDAAELTFESIKASLWDDYKIKTHYDSHRASILLKWVFDGLGDKTVHLYSRCFQLANGYDVDEADFTDFIKQMGGMEKIRKAYATVIAADAGTWRPVYVKDAEYSASLNELLGQKPLTVVQLTGKEGAAFRNDMFGYYCLVVAHIDPLNQLEMYGQWPANTAIENDILSRISNKNRVSGTTNWIENKAKATALSAERLQKKMATKDEKQKAKEKKAAAAAEKAAATEKRFAKQRVASALVVKPSVKPKAVAKKAAAKSPSRKAVK